MRAFNLVVLSVMLCGCMQRDEPAVVAVGNVNSVPASSAEQSAKGKFQRFEDNATAERDRKECASWTYDEGRVLADLGQMNPVSQEEWGRICYRYSCAYQGSMQIDGVDRTLVVNAGGWISVSGDGHTKYFASKKKFPGFLASCDCCE